MKTDRKPAWGPPFCTVLAEQSLSGHCCPCEHSPGNEPQMSFENSYHLWRTKGWKLPPATGHNAVNVTQ